MLAQGAILNIQLTDLSSHRNDGRFNRPPSKRLAAPQSDWNNIMIHRGYLYVSELVMLVLISACVAFAHSDKTRNQADELRTARDKWVPPDIDTTRPSVAPNVSCSLPDVIYRAGKQVQELVHNLDRLSVTEVVEHEKVGRSGNLRAPEIQKFNYVLSFKERPDGYMSGEEYRSSGGNSDQSFSEIDTRYVPSVVLAFHPNYVSNFRLSCEGLGAWRGQLAWQIRFEEPPDSKYNISRIIMRRKSYNVRFRGRAWILADTYQLIHIEMDLAEMIPDIHLRLYHQVFEYHSVSFPKGDVEFWLPSSAEIYMDFQGHRFYRRHSYVDFKLFSVKVH
jgi:hypothetical protein